MKNKIKVTLDVDGVLSDLYPHACFLANRKCDQIPSWSVPWLKDYLEKNLYERSSANQIFWARDLWVRQDAIRAMYNLDDIEIVGYISSLPEHFQICRKLWLGKYRFPYAPLVHTNNKPKAFKELGADIHIDDSPYVEKSFHDEGLSIYRFTPWFLAGAYKRTSSSLWWTFKDIREMFKHERK